jgi:hypothetical protein
MYREVLPVDVMMRSCRLHLDEAGRVWTVQVAVGAGDQIFGHLREIVVN